MVHEQQTKADMYIKNHINKIEFKDQEDNSVLSIPEEVTNVHGFTAIPPFLRIFPSALSLQNVLKTTKKPQPEVEPVGEQKGTEAENLKIKNKRDLEDKLVSITLDQHAAKPAEGKPPSKASRGVVLDHIAKAKNKLNGRTADRLQKDAGKETVQKFKKDEKNQDQIIQDLFGDDNNENSKAEESKDIGKASSSGTGY